MELQQGQKMALLFNPEDQGKYGGIMRTKRLLLLTVMIMLFLSTRPLIASPSEPIITMTNSGQIISLNWTAISGSYGYNLYYADYSNPVLNKIDMGLSTKIQVTLPKGSIYYVAVKAYDGTGESNWSNIIIIKGFCEGTITTLKNFSQTREQLVKYHNLANVIASLPTNQNNVNEIIDIKVIDENTIKIENLGNQTTIIDCYLAGLLLENITIEAGNSLLQTVPWDGTEYEYHVKYKGEYFSQLISVVTPTSQESYKRGLFFDGREAINKHWPQWESFIKVIDKYQNPVKKEMKLHGVEVSVYYSSESLPFKTEEEKNQFSYLMFTIFHQVWSHYQGFPYKTFEFLFVPVSEKWGNITTWPKQDNLNAETSAGIIFSADTIETHKFHPYMYAASVNESWFPYTFFFNFAPNAVWASKTMTEHIANNISNDIPLEPHWYVSDCIIKNPDIPLAEVFELHMANNNYSCGRYSYVKAQPMYLMIVNRYVENTGKESKTFYSEIYEKLLLKNPNFDPGNKDSLPFSTPLAEFEKILGEVIQDSKFIDTLFDKYVYNGQTYDDWDPGIFTSKIIPKIYPFFSYEEEFNKVRDCMVNEMSQGKKFVGVPF